MMGASLWAIFDILGTSTSSELFLHTWACAFTLNGFVFLLASVMSLQTALMLPKLFYVSARAPRPDVCFVLYFQVCVLVFKLMCSHPDVFTYVGCELISSSRGGNEGWMRAALTSQHRSINQIRNEEVIDGSVQRLTPLSEGF